MKNFKLPKPKNILKAPKMKLPKIIWEKEFDRELWLHNIDYDDVGSVDMVDFNEYGEYFTDLIWEYLFIQKVKIKVRKGAILIEVLK